MISSLIRNFVLDDRIKNIDRDSSDLLRIHLEIIKSKKMINNIFEEFYNLCAIYKNKYFINSNKKVIELGSGVSFVKDKYPDVITSDIKNYKGVDLVVNAQKMQFKDGEINCFYCINCFHHFPEPRKFFSELERTLEKGGGVILIEPYYGWFSNILYKKIHEEEFYDKGQVVWETGQKNNQFMTGANQALSYIVFVRDIKTFENEYPNLEILETKVINNYIRYLVSGGVNFKQLLPNFMEFPLKIMEFIFIPIKNIFGLHHMIVIRKK
ncbi:methyltransferase domain-containing protein [Sulfurimonas sp.]|uniref:methyltransferase domain-containing protein n=1 Tax=Sulfurimonas sp. TaxID=2022749 RepID=UPI002B4A1E75|nr:methyltransferase domain-containing protein [Sulfurimonas sp.]